MLSQRLSLLVKAKGLTQKSVAESIGVSEQALSRYLQGKSVLGADSLTQLLMQLGVNLEKVVDAEISKAMRVAEKPASKRRNRIARQDDETVAKLLDWMSATAKRPILRK